MTEFNSELKSPSLLSRGLHQITGWLRPQLQALGVLSPPTELTPEQEAAFVKDDVIGNFLDNLSVELVSKSRVISITFTSEDPGKSGSHRQQAGRGLHPRPARCQIRGCPARHQVADREDRRPSARRQCLRAGGGKIPEQGRALAGHRRHPDRATDFDLNTQLIQVQATRAEAEARLSQVRQLARTPGGAESAGDVLKSPIIQQLLEQETTVKRKVAELAQDYGDRHPRMISARAEVADVQAKILREVAKVISALENEVGVARAREAAMNRSLEQLKSNLSITNASNVQLQSLERDADASRTMLQEFLTRFEQTNAQLDSSVNDTNARVISRADVPDQPSFPPTPIIIAVAFIAGGLFSALIVLGLEQMDRGFRSGDQVEKATGLRSLGLVPMVSQRLRQEPGQLPAAASVLDVRRVDPLALHQHPAIAGRDAAAQAADNLLATQGGQDDDCPVPGADAGVVGALDGHRRGRSPAAVGPSRAGHRATAGSHRTGAGRSAARRRPGQGRRVPAPTSFPPASSLPIRRRSCRRSE